MYAYERKQLHYDFQRAPSLVKEHIPKPERRDALTMIRQVNVVTTYLSQMAVGEPRFEEGLTYAAGIAAMDCVTDYRNEKLSEGITEAALNGDLEYPELDLLDTANFAARGPRFEEAVKKVAKWQDKSLEQFGDMDPHDLLMVTESKGGYSALAHLHSIKDDPSDREDKFMLEFGAVMQLLDDYLDWREDEEAGISTVFTDALDTRGHLAHRASLMMDEAEELWGESRASRRFRRIIKLHMKLGDLSNNCGVDSQKWVPFYL